ncbi:hypothetical protein AB0J86_34150 [Micromonospora sp. NPDC049559]|uniref:hypothetical protein n=1 Tax=Micromonospora sp. NPDC049559 TaxID=3155923 RepID=UPI00341C9F12
MALVPAGPAGAAPVPAAALAPGFRVELTDLPGRLNPGAAPATIAAVVSRTGGGDCLKVRWSLLLRVRDARLDQVRVDRVEETGSFPVQVRGENGAARITDVQPDPGTLCRDRTVTARYRIAVDAGVAGGELTLTAEAYDENFRLLDRASAERQIGGFRAVPPQTRTTGPGAATPTAAPTVEDEPTVAPEDESTVPPESEAPAAGGAAGTGTGAGGGRADRASATGSFGVVQAGFILGGLLLFLGVGLLLRLRHLVRPGSRSEPGLPGPAVPEVAVSGGPSWPGAATGGAGWESISSGGTGWTRTGPRSRRRRRARA